MAWNLSTGAKKALGSGVPTVDIEVSSSGISFGDGDGAVISGADTINDTGNGLVVFEVGAFVTVANGTHKGIRAKVLDSSAAKLEVVAGTFAALSAAQTTIQVLGGGGSLAEAFKNGTLYLYSANRPANADLAEVGTLLAKISLNGGTFVSGAPSNGINIGLSDGTEMKRAIDPITAALEIWKGAGETGVNSAALFGRWHANTVVPGGSVTNICMDGRISTSGAEINMTNGTTVVDGVFSEVTDLSMTVSGV